MDKDEVIKRLNEHLKAKELLNGCLNRNDKYYCIRYVMDFLNMKKDQAKEFLRDNIPALASIKI